MLVLVVPIFILSIFLITHKVIFINGNWYNCNISTLELNDCTNDSIKNLRYFTSLRELTIHGNEPIVSIDFLTEMHNLEYLNLGNFNVNSWNSLKNCKKIRTLYGFNVNITDLSIVSDLTELETLLIQYNKVTSISGIDKLSKLKSLTIFSDISDLSLLENCTELLELDICDDNLDNIESLKKLHKLEKLRLAQSEKSTYSIDLSALIELKNLKKLSLININSYNYSALLNIESLQNLTVTYGILSDELMTELELKNIAIREYS